MSTPTKEQILRAFSLYMGCEFDFPTWPGRSDKKYQMSAAFLHHLECVDTDYKDCQLLLRDISSITDEECKEIAKLGFGHNQETSYTVERGEAIFIWDSRFQGRVSIYGSGQVYVERGGFAYDLDCEVSFTQNQSLIQQKFFEWGINMPLACLGGLTPAEAKIATIKKEVSNGN